MSENTTESFSHTTIVPIARMTIYDAKHGRPSSSGKFGLIQAALAHGELERGGAGRIPPVSGRDMQQKVSRKIHVNEISG